MLIEIAHTKFFVGRQKRVLNHIVQHRYMVSYKFERAISLGCILSL